MSEAASVAVARPMSTAGAAEYLGLCEETVLRLVRRGKLPAIRHEASNRPIYRFLQSDLDAYVAASRTVKPKAKRQARLYRRYK